MKKLYPGVALCFLLLGVKAQNVNIPDAAFKTFLLAKDSINTNHDGEIQVAEAAAYTGSLMIVINGVGTHNLTGIEAFVNLTKLECYARADSLNLSANTALTQIWCNGGGLTSLVLPATTTLTGLDCSFSSLTAIDVSANTSLVTFRCSGNQLSTLNVTANRSLQTLDCSNNKLSVINLFGDTALTYLDCSNNLLPALDVSQNLQLVNLGCDRNNLSTLNLPTNTGLSFLSCNSNLLSGINLSANHLLQNLSCDSNYINFLNLSANTSLRTLSCAANQLTSLILPPNTSFVSIGCRSNKLANLDVSTSTDLSYLDCSHNLLTKLKAKVGATKDFVQFSAYGNPNLTCIEVDSVDYFVALWSSTKDAWASYSANCSYSGINESDKANTTFSLSPNPATTNVILTIDESMIGNIASITDVSGRKIAAVQLSAQNSTLNTSYFPSGLYFICIGNSTRKLIIEK